MFLQLFSIGMLDSMPVLQVARACTSQVTPSNCIAK